MENVADILKFFEGYLAWYALRRLVLLDYQAWLGMMVAGCYGELFRQWSLLVGNEILC
jgi:DNA (cytosine-5)-methyltransferase 1